jgi:hypothetical protein
MAPRPQEGIVASDRGNELDVSEMSIVTTAAEVTIAPGISPPGYYGGWGYRRG